MLGAPQDRTTLHVAWWAVYLVWSCFFQSWIGSFHRGETFFFLCFTLQSRRDVFEALNKLECKSKRYCVHMYNSEPADCPRVLVHFDDHSMWRKPRAGRAAAQTLKRLAQLTSMYTSAHLLQEALYSYACVCNHLCAYTRGGGDFSDLRYSRVKAQLLSAVREPCSRGRTQRVFHLNIWDVGPLFVRYMHFSARNEKGISGYTLCTERNQSRSIWQWCAIHHGLAMDLTYNIEIINGFQWNNGKVRISFRFGDRNGR